MRWPWLFFILLLFGCQRRSDINSYGKGLPCYTLPATSYCGVFTITYSANSCDGESYPWRDHVKIYVKDTVVYQPSEKLEIAIPTKEQCYTFEQGITQLLLHVSNRPGIDYQLCVTVAQDKVFSVMKMPCFNYPAMDFDGDGLPEYAGQMYSPDSDTEDSVWYNPVYYVEQSPTGFRVDSALIEAANAKLFGIFRGYEALNVYVKRPDTALLNKWLNRN